MRIACVIPTYNGKSELRRLLDSLQTQTAQFDILIVDSSSTDGTQELAKSNASEIFVIPSKEFNHGGTRQLIVDKKPNYDIYVFLTQDTILANINSLSILTSHFSDPNVGAVCGRQLPHLDASLLSKHARYFNYPDKIQVKTMVDVTNLGLKTAFLSNSFAAYRAEALKDVNGFPNYVIFAEDMFVAAKMLLSGWKVTYAGNAECRHSHNYSIAQEFQRYFDMGVFHARERWVRKNFGGAGGEGLKYQISELRYLGFYYWYLWPVSIYRNAIKLVGYKLGQYEAKLPIGLKRRFSMYKRYWDGPFSLKQAQGYKANSINSQ